MTLNDLVKVKLGHGQLGSISDYVHGYRIFDRSKFHPKIIIIWFLLYHYNMVTSYDLLKVKQGHYQMGSISGLIYHNMSRHPCKFHSCT